MLRTDTSLNSDEDVVKVMGADVPAAVQSQAFPELRPIQNATKDCTGQEGL